MAFSKVSQYVLLVIDHPVETVTDSRLLCNCLSLLLDCLQAGVLVKEFNLS